jgi:hypothetical protein
MVRFFFLMAPSVVPVWGRIIGHEGNVELQMRFKLHTRGLHVSKRCHDASQLSPSRLAFKGAAPVKLTPIQGLFNEPHAV